jgi:hypothetical protein
MSPQELKKPHIFLEMVMVLSFRFLFVAPGQKINTLLYTGEELELRREQICAQKKVLPLMRY